MYSYLIVKLFLYNYCGQMYRKIASVVLFCSYIAFREKIFFTMNTQPLNPEAATGCACTGCSMDHSREVVSLDYVPAATILNSLPTIALHQQYKFELLILDCNLWQMIILHNGMI